MSIDEIDLKILKNLLVDARQSARKLSLKLGLSTVTVLSRIKKLEKLKIIKGYTAILDDEKLGYDLTAIIEISVKKGQMALVEKEVSTLDKVCAVYDITGQTDAIVIAKFKNREELSEFVKQLSAKPNVEYTNTHMVLNTVKEDFRII
ncbi:MAG: Lrp/AsnC family transcriptional regulator [Nitrosopumilaceae archaeon]